MESIQYCFYQCYPPQLVLKPAIIHGEKIIMGTVIWRRKLATVVNSQNRRFSLCSRPLCPCLVNFHSFEEVKIINQIRKGRVSREKQKPSLKSRKCLCSSTWGNQLIVLSCPTTYKTVMQSLLLSFFFMLFCLIQIPFFSYKIFL